MTGDIINLRRVRKAKARDEATVLADANRARHGQTGLARRAREDELTRAARRLDGHRLDDQKLDDQRLDDHRLDSDRPVSDRLLPPSGDDL